MDFKEFVEQVKNELPGHFTEAFKNAEVSLTEVNKLQGQSYSGISIRPENDEVGVTVGLEGYYQHYQEGHSMDSIVSQIAKNAEYHLADIP